MTGTVPSLPLVNETGHAGSPGRPHNLLSDSTITIAGSEHVILCFRKQLTYRANYQPSDKVPVLLPFRRDCELMAGELCKAGITAQCYHAGLSDSERSAVQQRWLTEDRCKVCMQRNITVLSESATRYM